MLGLWLYHRPFHFVYMSFSTDHYQRCIETLRLSIELLLQSQPETARYEVYRNAVIKGFDLVLEMTATLLRRALKHYGASTKSIDVLSFKDIFRHAARHGIIAIGAIDRWFLYRDNRNVVAHEYGEKFAEATLVLLPEFRAGSVCLNSFRPFAKWIPASIMQQPGLAAAS